MATRVSGVVPGSSLQSAHLVVFKENTALTFELPRVGEIVIGRSPNVALPLGDRSASRQHAKLSIHSSEVTITDLGSRNGTRVNGEPIREPRLLITGDVITICSAFLIFYRQSPVGDASIYSGAQPASSAVKAAETATTVKLGDRSIVLADPTMLQTYALIEKLAPSDLPVLIMGETGVGKEFAAWALHHQSRRQGRPFLSVNCAALPESLVESELFGHDRGAFSGAVAAKQGLLEAASGGTIFLDEVGELPLPIQAKLLRVLETQKLLRVGEIRERAIDVRIIAATNRDLQSEIASGRFRKDLYFRLGAARLTLPPLRARRRELPVLVRALLAEACKRLQRELIEVSPEAMARLQTYHWPGNVRELRNVLDFAAATVEGSVLLPWHLQEQVSGADPFENSASPPLAPSAFRPIDEELKALEKQRMAEALLAAKGVHVRAAELIAMPIRTFTTKLKQYQLGSRK